MALLIDTHCHLDAREFDADRAQVMERARHAGVASLVLPAVDVASFEKVRALAHEVSVGAYAVGIHPMYVRHSGDNDLALLDEFVCAHLDDPRLVAIGEIGLDFFVPEIREGVQRERQIDFYRQQLVIAQRYHLPVLLHVRRSQDELLKWLRRTDLIGGIAHAFNGSDQQALQFCELGFVLGMGGAFTYTRARQIRHLAMNMPLTSLVLETDAPDIAPAWLDRGARNEPAEVFRIAEELAQLRQMDVDTLINATAENAFRVLPRLQRLFG